MAFVDLFDIPPGAATSVSIIDSSLRLSNISFDALVTPPLEGYTILPTAPLWSFLIEHSSNQKVLFDLGVAKDLTQYVPSVYEGIVELPWVIEVEMNVADILKKNDIDPSEIDTIVWR
jgi:hypothetical protein